MKYFVRFFLCLPLLFGCFVCICILPTVLDWEARTPITQKDFTVRFEVIVLALFYWSSELERMFERMEEKERK